jgi:hypothetical protein
LVISGFSTSGHYTVSGLGDGVIRRGDTIKVTVKLNTDFLDKQPGTISFRTNDEDESSFEINLRAKVYEPVVTDQSAKLTYPMGGSYAIIARAGDHIELAPAHGRTPPSGKYALQHNDRTYHFDGALTKLIIRGQGDLAKIENWTKVPIFIDRFTILSSTKSPEVAAAAVPPLDPAFSFEDDAIVVSGTAAADRVTLRKVKGDQYEIGMTTGKTTKSQQFTLGAVNESSGRPVNRVVFHGGDGDDRFDNYTDISTTLDGGRGNDILNGGGGVDVINGGEGDDVLDGKGGDDRLSGGVGKDYLLGRAGNDLLKGNSGDDKLDGGDGEDEINGNDGDDLMYGGNGDDTMNGGEGHDRMYGYDGNDVMRGGNGDDFVDGRNGDDQLFGDAGNDYLLGRAGNDRLQGGSGDDQIYGGDGHDQLWGQSGNDRIYGGNGNDGIDAGSGNDYVHGGAGNDTIKGGTGKNQLHGGAGRDNFLVVYANWPDNLLADLDSEDGEWIDWVF